jgi:hypothetical protein
MTEAVSFNHTFETLSMIVLTDGGSTTPPGSPNIERISTLPVSESHVMHQFVLTALCICCFECQLSLSSHGQPDYSTCIHLRFCHSALLLACYCIFAPIACLILPQIICVNNRTAVVHCSIIHITVAVLASCLDPTTANHAVSCHRSILPCSLIVSTLHVAPR